VLRVRVPGAKSRSLSAQSGGEAIKDRPFFSAPDRYFFDASRERTPRFFPHFTLASLRTSLDFSEAFVVPDGAMHGPSSQKHGLHRLDG
jgi:hypothetical protein